MHNKTQADRHVALVDTSLRLSFNVFLFLSHQTGSSLIPLLDVPLLSDSFCNLLFLQLLQNMLCCLSITLKNLRSNVHLQFLFWYVIDAVPKLCIGLLRVAWIFEVDCSLFDE